MSRIDCFHRGTLLWFEVEAGDRGNKRKWRNMRERKNCIKSEDSGLVFFFFPWRQSSLREKWPRVWVQRISFSCFCQGIHTFQYGHLEIVPVCVCISVTFPIMAWGIIHSNTEYNFLHKRCTNVLQNELWCLTWFSIFSFKRINVSKVKFAKIQNNPSVFLEN